MPQFKMEIAAWVGFLALLALVPLFFFVPHLAEARRNGLRQYGILASRYVADFRSKWIENKAPATDPLLGTSDIQSLADLSNAYDTIREMSLVPFTWKMVARLMIVLLLPFFPLVLTIIPIEEIIDRAAGMIF